MTSWGTSLVQPLDYHGILLLPPDYHALVSLEQQIGKQIPVFGDSSTSNIGYLHRNQHIVVLRLCELGLSSLPEDVCRLPQLRELYLYANHLSSMPETFGDLEALERLDIERNELFFLPKSLGMLSRLTVIWANHNALPHSSHSEEGNGCR